MTESRTYSSMLGSKSGAESLVGAICAPRWGGVRGGAVVRRDECALDLRVCPQRDTHVYSAIQYDRPFTAVFRSIGHTILAPRERRLSITTYLRSDRAKIRLIFFLIAFLGLIFLFSYFLIILSRRKLSASLPMEIPETPLGY